MIIIKHSAVVAAVRAVLKGHQIKVWNDKRSNHRRIKIGVCCPEGVAKVRATLKRLGINFEEGSSTMAVPFRGAYTPYVWECISFYASHGGHVESRFPTVKSFAKAA